MKLAIDFATQGDLNWIKQNDHLKSENVVQKIDKKEYIVAKINNKPIGYLRFSLFWSEIPYIDIITVEDEHKRQGVGKAMLDFLERYAIKNNIKVVMSSSQQDEAQPQEWHRKMGFKDAGAIEHFQPIQDVPEIIFLKKLGE